jgi:hypothetical protein
VGWGGVEREGKRETDREGGRRKGGSERATASERESFQVLNFTVLQVVTRRPSRQNEGLKDDKKITGGLQCCIASLAMLHCKPCNAALQAPKLMPNLRFVSLKQLVHVAEPEAARCLNREAAPPSSSTECVLCGIIETLSASS